MQLYYLAILIAYIYIVNIYSAYELKTCGGGLFWTACSINKPPTYKNAITNELGILGAIRLYNSGASSLYLDKALLLWSWFENSGMISQTRPIIDGLSSKTCKVTGNLYTYNSGVILYALSELTTATKNTTLMDIACDVADISIKHFSESQNNNNILQVYLLLVNISFISLFKISFIRY